MDCWPAVDCWPTVNRLAKANWWSVGSLSVIHPWSHFGISLKVQITNHKHALKAASDTDVSPFSQLKTQWVRKGRRYFVTFAFNCPSYFVFVNSPPSLYFVPKCTPNALRRGWSYSWHSSTYRIWRKLSDLCMCNCISDFSFFPLFENGLRIKYGQSSLPLDLMTVSQDLKRKQTNQKQSQWVTWKKCQTYAKKFFSAVVKLFLYKYTSVLRQAACEPIFKGMGRNRKGWNHNESCWSRL